MKHLPLLIAALFFAVGCDGGSVVEPTSLPTPVTDHQSLGPSPTDTTLTGTSPRSDIAKGSAEQLVFNLSDAARDKVRDGMSSVAGGTHLVVTVDVDDEKYCVGFHYNLNVEANPSATHFALLESNGIKLAIEKDDIKFLNGTTLDYAILASGTEGFVFRNPNENRSLPDELREEQPPQTDLEAQADAQASPQ